MRLNSRGQAIHGYVSLNLDGEVLLPGVRTTPPAWLTDDEACYQVYRNGIWSLEACEVATRQTRPLDPRGANLIDSSAGVWCAWNLAGIRSNVHPFLLGAGLRGVGWDGCLGYSRSQQQGTGLVMRAVDGTATPEIAAGVGILDTHIVAFGVAAFTSRYELFTVGTPPPETVPEQVFEPRLLQLESGEWWVSYHTQDRLLFHPLVEPVGYVVAEGPFTYSPDCCQLTDGIVRIVYSTTKGEGPSSFRKKEISLTSPRKYLPLVPEPPRVTITSYAPSTGIAPLVVRAVRALSGGPADRLHWRARRRGDATWILVADNPATDPDHHYRFDSPGTFELSVTVIGPGGSDTTAIPRRVEVT